MSDNDKSYVTLEQHRCLICGKDYATGSLLLDRRLRQTFDHYTVTGNGLCPEHEVKHKEGYIAFIEIDPAKGTKDSPWHTGTMVYVRRSVARELFVNIPEENFAKAVWYMQSDVTAKLKKLADSSVIGSVQDITDRIKGPED